MAVLKADVRNVDVPLTESLEVFVGLDGLMYVKDYQNTIQLITDYTGSGGGGAFTQDETTNSITPNNTCSTISEDSFCSSILGGKYGSIENASNYSVISGGYGSKINSSDCSSIGAGNNSYICSSRDSAIGSGYRVSIRNSRRSFIGGGYRNSISNSRRGSVLGGCYNFINSGDVNSIVGGGSGNINYSYNSTIVNGRVNTIYRSDCSSIVGSEDGYLSYSCHSGILNGYDNKICFGESSSIISSDSIELSCYPTGPVRTTAISSCDSNPRGTRSVILGANESGGVQFGTCRTAVFGGNIIGTVSDYVFVSNLCNVGGGTSDERLKENIKPLTFGLQELSQLEPVEYNFCSDESKATKYGFLAQNVQAVMPSLVSHHPTDLVDGEPVLQFDKDAVWSSLVNGLKELKTRVELLENK